MEPERITTNSKAIELDRLEDEYGQNNNIPITSKEELSHLWSVDIMAYMISWPVAQGTPGIAVLLTNKGQFYSVDYCRGELTYDDLRCICTDLPESFEQLKPWDIGQEPCTLPKSMEEFGKLKPWEFDGSRNISGWYWYGLHSGCLARIHESIWPTFYELVERYKEFGVSRHWDTFARKALADRLVQLEKYLTELYPCKKMVICPAEEVGRIVRPGIIAWKECDQGFTGMLCKNGLFIMKIEYTLWPFIPYGQKEEVQNRMGWRRVYCGLGHSLFIRKEYLPRFRELTYGLGKNARLYEYGFDILADILNGFEDD